MSIRYYLYISDTKLDMLLPQIDPALLRQRTSGWGGGGKVFQWRREEVRERERVAGLERVVRHLQDHGDVGAVDEPGQFFWGIMPMRWDLVQNSVDAGMVYFGGRTERTVVGLGGSPRHLLHSPVDRPEELVPASLTPAMLTFLRALGEAGEPGDGSAASGDDAHGGWRPVDPAGGDAVGGGLAAGLDIDRRDPRARDAGDDRAALAMVHRVTAGMRGPTQNLEFLAKRLLHGRSPYAERGESVLLGSPLYVAQVD
ncbi:hypothetical protein C6361_34215 [Plantactinospora sp. BC1]|uniref:DUF7019 family protein n=1 Tax=Plantactinospora sp. BC1 TaxID=2108470 RepID=UPI000D176E21|nr:SAVMC3_10250 family protein [Plantactinospora sp. BC1]AVT33665.1 hypothetical protein C6361_34215 [Plantactinospora sp. BC1]